MGQYLAWVKRAATRVNARVAAGVVTLLVGGVAVWQGTAYFSKKPSAPTKQVATGVDKADSAVGTVQPAVASLSDDQLPVASGGLYRQVQYNQPADGSSSPHPQTNPYLPSTNDAGGYGSRRAASSPYRIGQV